MRPSLVAFLSFLVAAVTIVVLEALVLNARYEQFQAQILRNSEMTLSLMKREAALQRFKLKNDALENKAALLLNGYTPEPLAVSEENFGDLFSLGVQISPQEESANKGAKIWTYKLSSTTIEFHRLMPAISGLENQYPLGRFIEIDLKSTRAPFALSPGPIAFTGIFSTLRGQL
jgi:hypothetical protein